MSTHEPTGMSEGQRRRQDRLWAFTLHEDGVFNSRQNLFLVAESMLVVAYTTALEAKGDTSSVIAVVGLLLTLAWLYASIRHSFIINHIQEKAKTDFPDYREIYEGRKWWFLPVPSRIVTSLVVPALTGALWVALLLAQP